VANEKAFNKMKAETEKLEKKYMEENTKVVA
jgi:hypothetical protein